MDKETIREGDFSTIAADRFFVLVKQHKDYLYVEVAGLISDRVMYEKNIPVAPGEATRKDIEQIAVSALSCVLSQETVLTG